MTLQGINFSRRLEDNVVTFRAGSTRIRGTPVAVTFPPPECGRRLSLLDVLVPTGAPNGSLELEVNGIFAGAFGYVACPTIMSVDIGEDGSDPTLFHFGFIDFGPQIDTTVVRLHGLNFEEVIEIVIEDSSGTQSCLAPADFRRRSLVPANGLDTLLFSLDEVRLGVRPARDNLLVRGFDLSRCRGFRFCELPLVRRYRRLGRVEQQHQPASM